VLLTIGQADSLQGFPLSYIGKLIRHLQGTNYIHYFMSYRSLSGQTMYFDADIFGVWKRTRDKFMKDYQIRALWSVPLPCSTGSFERWVETHMGKPYGFLHLFGLLLALLKKRYLNKEMGNPYKDQDRRFTCNELVDALLTSTRTPSIIQSWCPVTPPTSTSFC
jgi:hypothetical protein